MKVEIFKYSAQPILTPEEVYSVTVDDLFHVYAFENTPAELTTASGEYAFDRYLTIKSDEFGTNVEVFIDGEGLYASDISGNGVYNLVKVEDAYGNPIDQEVSSNNVVFVTFGKGN